MCFDGGVGTGRQRDSQRSECRIGGGGIGAGGVDLDRVVGGGQGDRSGELAEGEARDERCAVVAVHVDVDGEAAVTGDSVQHRDGAVGALCKGCAGREGHDQQRHDGDASKSAHW